MRQLYTWIFRLAIPAILIRLMWRSWRAPAYRHRWKERFAWFEAPEQKGGLWLHAVSLGESIAAIPLIKAFKANHPNVPVCVTNMTPTGSEKIRATFGAEVFNVYVPYDLPGIIKRFLKKIQPKLVIIMETELWPNILHYTHKAQIPILLANARLSERSAARYAKISRVTRRMLRCLTIIAAQTQAEAERYIALGAFANTVVVTGSIKFDISIPRDLEDKAQGLRRMLGAERLIWIAASTHEGEDEQVLAVFAKIKKIIPQLLLILVPRHPERFTKVANLCKRQGYEIVLRSENQHCTLDTNIFVGDTVGEMLLFYAAADLAFVGGSLVPVGGHNLLEPAALGKAAVTGLYMHNFLNITELLLTAQAIKCINNEEELFQAVLFYLQDKTSRLQAGANGLKVIAQNRGALTKHLEFIEKLFNQSTG